MATTVPVITIDGPSGSGKGTVSQLLAEKLGWHFLDSGAIYRVLAYYALKQDIAPDDEAQLVDLAGDLPVQFEVNTLSATPLIFLQGKAVTQAIRSEACGTMASRISALEGVRAALLARQRDFRQVPGLVADGRDMGTVVFPDAQLKIFLNASLQERAQRRYVQLKGQLKRKGINVSLEQVLAELEERDRRDQQRAIAPLQPAEDAVVIDTTHLSAEQVLARILAKVK